MAKARKNKKNDDSMLCVKDMEDLAKELSNLQKLKEELKMKIDKKQSEIELWKQILSSKTTTEQEEIVNNSPLTNLLPMTKEMQDRLTEFNFLDAALSVYRKSGIMANLTSKGHILVQFLPTKTDTFPEKLLLALSHDKKNNTYSVVEHNLVDFVPVDELVEEYLNGPQGDVQTFITHVAMYTSKMIKRHNMFEIVRSKLIHMMHYNADRTRLNIMLSIEQGKEPVTYEIILHYHPLDLLPYKVESDNYDGARPTGEIRDSMKDLVEQLHEFPLWDVLFETLADETKSDVASGSIEGSEYSNILG